MKIFIKKTLLYSILLLSIYLFPLSIYILSRDYVSLDKVVNLQYSKPNVLFSFSYFGESYVAYKTLLLQKVKPDVIAFGSSRTFQIRKEFFNKPETFVNASVPRPSIGNLINLKNLIDELPNDGKKRELVLLLDKRYFTERYDTSSDIKNRFVVNRFSHLIGKPLRLVYLDYFSGKYSLTDFVSQSQNSDNIGLWSLVRDSGVRADGSVKEGYEETVSNRKDVLKGDISARVEEIKNYNPTLLLQEEKNIPKNLEDLKSILDLCKQRNIDVVAFIPPDPVEVAKEIKSNTSPYAQSQTKLASSISDIFSEYNFSFFDLSDITQYGGSDDEFIDLIHGGDLLYAKAILYMAQNNSNLKSYVNVSGLQEIIKNTKGDFLNF